ncbi:MAG: hypothetical protein IJ438_05740 [Clostridia bacterium]|nr:hypothetical protein [Clostridia bacterium]
MEELIRKVLFTLDTIEVKGRANIDRMLGCMQLLEKVADALAHNHKVFSEVKTNSPLNTREGALIK